MTQEPSQRRHRSSTKPGSASRAATAANSRIEYLGVPGERTRGGWKPAGTAAERRAVHDQRGTKRGERTKRQIIDAARRVFEREDYLTVGVADITREAQVAHGTFYTYFTSKVDVFRVICMEVSEAVDESIRPATGTERPLDPVQALRESNWRYVETYRQNSRIYAMMNRLEHMDDELMRANIARQQRHIERVGAQIRRWQDCRIADLSVDPEPTAAALILAIANVCYWLFEKHDKSVELDTPRHVEAVNEIWIRALGLRPNPDQR